MHTKGFGIKQSEPKGDKIMDSNELFGEVTDREPVNEAMHEQIQEQIEEDTRKGNNGVAVAVVTLLFILVIGLCVYIAVSISKMVPQSGQEDKEYESQTGDPWEEILGDDYIDESNQTSGDVSEYPNYEKEDFAGPYYREVVDCIDESVSYEIERKHYDLDEKEHNVYIATSYIQLEGDIPGMDEINRLLEENVTYFAKNYEDNKSDILGMLDENSGIRAEIKSYVTYNTEHMISVVVREDIAMGYMYQDVALYCYNINLDTGTILDNTTMLNLGDGFGQEFRDRSNAQNGISEGGVEPYSNAQIEAMLNDETSLILFYTPLGVEVGYNYKGDYYTGWITITMQDYENYLPSL